MQGKTLLKGAKNMSEKPYPFEACKQCCNTGADIDPSYVVSDVLLVAESDGSHSLDVLRLDGSGGFDPVALASKKYVDDNVEKITDEIYLTSNTADYNSGRLDQLIPRVDNMDIDVDVLKTQMGDIETALDNIITIQNTLIGGDSV